MKKFSSYTWFLFLALSAVGVFLFITPISTADGLKVPIAILANWLALLRCILSRKRDHAH